jgi:hypothetical protein
LGATSNIVTGFAVNTPQVIGTGTLLTPSSEGIFNVDLIGNANLFTVGPTTLSTVPAVVGASPGFTVVTRFPTRTTTTQPSGDGDTNGTGNGTDTGGQNGTSTISGGPSGPSGPINDSPDDEQVAGEIPDGPPLTGSMTGMCGLGIVSAMWASLLGLGLMSLNRLHSRRG